MKIKAPWRCDYCLNLKGENNHWFLFLPNWLLEANNRMQANTELVQFEHGALFVKWNDVVAEMVGVEHVCSESCAGKALSKWLAKPRLDLDAKKEVTDATP